MMRNLLTGFFLLAGICVQGQDSTKKFISVRYHHTSDTNKDSLPTHLLKSQFSEINETLRYVDSLPKLLEKSGYWGVAIDSISRTDSLVSVKLFLGIKTGKMMLQFKDEQQRQLFEACTQKSADTYLIESGQWNAIQDQLLVYLENTGFPFAKVSMDSCWINNSKMNLRLFIEKGPFYHIDSIRIFGDAKISPGYLSRYTNILPGSAYSKKKVATVDALLKKLPFLEVVQPADITMLGSGGVVNVYLKNKKSSQFNFLLGVQPGSGNNKKIQLTGDVLLDLKNLFAKGEKISFKWQQLLPQSPRLDLSWNRPYWSNSPLGTDVQFDMYKKDSVYALFNARIGIQYDYSPTEKFQFFFKLQQTNLLASGIDTQLIKQSKKLPEIIDMSAYNLGVTWQLKTIDNPIVPTNGSDWTFTAFAGKRNIYKNADILAIKDTTFQYSSIYDTIQLQSFQFSLRAMFTEYIRLSKTSHLKSAVQLGWYQAPKIFKNNLFQIGGFQTLRGFDEESIFASRFWILTNEYRLLIGNNSFLSFFVDAAGTKYKTNTEDKNFMFLSAGTGLLFETKAGMLNVMYALGKRNDIPFNWGSASKIHFGYINYF